MVFSHFHSLIVPYNCISVTSDTDLCLLVRDMCIELRPDLHGLDWAIAQSGLDLRLIWIALAFIAMKSQEP